MRPELRAACLALACGALGGCEDREVVAEVGETELRIQDLDHHRASRRTALTPAEELDALVARQALAEAAREEGLADDPVVQARIRAAERELLAQALQERLAKEHLGEEALRARYESRKEQLAVRRVHVRQIVVRIGEGGVGAATSRANALYARVLAGEDFARVARESSEDPATAPKGGDLGPLREGTVEPTFFEAAAALAPGEVSKPVVTPFGVHVLQAIEPETREIPAFAEIRGKLAVEALAEAERSSDAAARLLRGARVYPERIPPAGAR